jgi:hypothetical protein
VERWKKAAAGKGVREEKFNRLVAVQGSVASEVEKGTNVCPIKKISPCRNRGRNQN